MTSLNNKEKTQPLRKGESCFAFKASRATLVREGVRLSRVSSSTSCCQGPSLSLLQLPSRPSFLCLHHASLLLEGIPPHSPQVSLHSQPVQSPERKAPTISLLGCPSPRTVLTIQSTFHRLCSGWMTERMAHKKLLLHLSLENPLRYFAFNKYQVSSW